MVNDWWMQRKSYLCCSRSQVVPGWPGTDSLLESGRPTDTRHHFVFPEQCHRVHLFDVRHKIIVWNKETLMIKCFFFNRFNRLRHGHEVGCLGVLLLGTFWSQTTLITIRGFLEESLFLLGFSLLALCDVLFTQKFRDCFCMQSTALAKQNKQQRPSSHVHNTHTTREERSR